MLGSALGEAVAELRMASPVQVHGPDTESLLDDPLAQGQQPSWNSTAGGCDGLDWCGRAGGVGGVHGVTVPLAGVVNHRVGIGQEGAAGSMEHRAGQAAPAGRATGSSRPTRSRALIRPIITAVSSSSVTVAVRPPAGRPAPRQRWPVRPKAMRAALSGSVAYYSSNSYRGLNHRLMIDSLAFTIIGHKQHINI